MSGGPIIDPSEQGSLGWLQARLGIVTASVINQLIAPVKRQRSKSGDKLMLRLLFEWLSGKPSADGGMKSFWTERGNLVEEDAILCYESLTDTDTTEVGFCYMDERKLLGASTDRLVGDDGQVEAKCPEGSVALATLMAGVLPTEHVNQVQTGLAVTGRDWCDFISYHPDLPPFLLRVKRDDSIIQEILGVVEEFTVEMLEARERLISMGYEPRVTSPAVDEALGF